MSLKELFDKNFFEMKVIVSWAYNKGIEWEDLLKDPFNELWNLQISHFSKTKKYDLVINVR